MTIGLVGYGRFGAFAARHLAGRANVLVFDARRRYGRFPSPRIAWASLTTVAAQEVVILAVPVSRLEATLRAIAPYLRPRALVVDVCSVKIAPVRWMRTLLPRGVYALGAHPLFGPDSARDSLKGHTVVLCPVRIPIRLLRTVRVILRSCGLTTRVMTPAQHDRLMAETLLVTQFVGRTIARSGLKTSTLATPSYRALMNIARIADNDTRELFRDMMCYNPFAEGVVRRILRAQKTLLKTMTPEV